MRRRGGEEVRRRGGEDERTRGREDKRKFGSKSCMEEHYAPMQFFETVRGGCIFLFRGQVSKGIVEDKSLQKCLE